MNHEGLDLRALVVFLAAAGLIIPVMQRLKVSPVLGFLLVGLVLGPFGLGRLTDDLPVLRYVVITELEGVRALAELGIVFLLFVIGLELSFDRLLAMRRLVFGLGAAQVVATAIVIAGLAALAGSTPAVAIVIGACLALSSTAIVMQLLTERGALGARAGRAAFAVLLFQDLAVVPILFLVGVLGAKSSAGVELAFLLAVAQAAFAIVLILGLGRLVARPIFRFVGATKSPELFMATVLLAAIGTATATAAAGLSLALGAFLAGLLLAETEYRHEIEVDVEPFKGLLLGVFFLSVGMELDLARIAADPLWAVAGVIGLFALKAAILFPLARLFGLAPAPAAETALLLGQAGEFAFVVMGLASGLGVVPPATAQFVILVTALTMAITPLIAGLARRIGAALERRVPHSVPGPEEAPDDLEGHVVVAGYGRVGRLVGELLDTQKLAHVGLDTEPALVASARDAGAAVFFGDASRPEILARVGIARARALAVTINDPAAAARVVEAVRRARPDLPILARARDSAHALELVAAGATQVVPETIEASLQLGELVLVGAGLPYEAARQLVEERRIVELDVFRRE